jgi:hypothetical protein
MALPFLSFDLFSLSLFAVFYGLDWLASVPPTVRLSTEAFGERDGPIIFGGWRSAIRSARPPPPSGRRSARTPGPLPESFVIAACWALAAAVAALTIRRPARAVRGVTPSLSQGSRLRPPMNALAIHEPRRARVPLPSRGGAMAVLDFGPPGRPVRHRLLPRQRVQRAHLRQHPRAAGGDAAHAGGDMRGHGASTLPTVIEGREGWPQFRDDLLALLGAETAQPVVLAGTLWAHRQPAGRGGRTAAGARPGPLRSGGVGGEGPAVVGDNPLADGAQRRRATFPSKAAAIAAYTGKGGFRAWSAEQLADYVEAGFRETDEGEVTLTCTPAWEASNFRTHNYDAFAAFRAVRCPIRILKAETASTARIEAIEPELLATGRITIQTIPRHDPLPAHGAARPGACDPGGGLRAAGVTSRPVAVH